MHCPFRILGVHTSTILMFFLFLLISQSIAFASPQGVYFQLYPSNSDYLEIQIDASNLKRNQYIPSSILGVKFKQSNGKSVKKEFSIPQISSGQYRMYQEHGIANVISVESGSWKGIVEISGGKVDDGKPRPPGKRFEKSGQRKAVSKKAGEQLLGQKPPSKRTRISSRRNPNYPPNYLGCFKDKGDASNLKNLTNRDLNGTHLSKNNMTVRDCRFECGRKGFKYAGLQYSSQCYCGNSYGKYGKLKDQNCSSLCCGNPTKICGGSWANSVYKAR